LPLGLHTQFTLGHFGYPCPFIWFLGWLVSWLIPLPHALCPTPFAATPTTLHTHPFTFTVGHTVGWFGWITRIYIPWFGYIARITPDTHGLPVLPLLVGYVMVGLHWIAFGYSLGSRFDLPSFIWVTPFTVGLPRFPCPLLRYGWIDLDARLVTLTFGCPARCDLYVTPRVWLPIPERVAPFAGFAPFLFAQVGLLLIVPRIPARFALTCHTHSCYTPHTPDCPWLL